MQKNETTSVSLPKPQNVLTYVLLAIIIVQGFFNLYFLTGNSLTLPASTGIDALGVKNALLAIEYAKVGGKENYDLINQATIIQMKEQIPQIKQFISSNGGVNPTEPAPTPTEEAKVMEASKIESILSGVALEGNPQADIVVIEYSDMECPFCVRQYSETKLRLSLLSQYGDKVVFAFKNNRGVNHSGTEAKAIGALCAKKIGGSEAYAKFYHHVMDGTTQTNIFPVANLIEAAKAAKIDVKKWQTCYDAKETSAEFISETQEAQSLGLAGTPGTLILNVKTGKYATVEGAYPIDSFVQKINSLMQ